MSISWSKPRIMAWRNRATGDPATVLDDTLMGAVPYVEFECFGQRYVIEKRCFELWYVNAHEDEQVAAKAPEKPVMPTNVSTAGSLLALRRKMTEKGEKVE